MEVGFTHKYSQNVLGLYAELGLAETEMRKAWQINTGLPTFYFINNSKRPFLDP